MEDHLDDLERDIVERPNQAVMESALNLKRDLTILRHALVPMKEAGGRWISLTKRGGEAWQRKYVYHLDLL